jgi:hypothetical protein
LVSAFTLVVFCLQFTAKAVKTIKLFVGSSVY